ncbi:hypothetical protein DH2020_016837 [Rehmannia glutinosa]|uniref:Transmembrane protein n=1 Tax=Rehmannia glutinosa TaxID=99300 RepID=A0ABR0WP40_REHGL
MSYRRSTSFSSVSEVFSLNPLPYPVLLILAVIFIFLGLQWYVSLESAVEVAEESMVGVAVNGGALGVVFVAVVAVGQAVVEGLSRGGGGWGWVAVGSGGADLVVACDGAVPVYFS